MNGDALVIDSSVVIKWVVEEDGTRHALALREWARLMAPDLLIAECANALWKKVQRKEFSRGEALYAARLLESADIELVPSRSLLEAATRIAIDVDHPAYDCLYLALATAKDCRFVTADERLLGRLARAGRSVLRERAISLNAAAELPRLTGRSARRD